MNTSAREEATQKKKIQEHWNPSSWSLFCLSKE
ncbi:hypothetical protein FOCG_12958 [Fusarium oxysporum f. sp. radicis-lycopersici 26381]|uniref:Uncharacterized protein n=2 Tax=Fusarium oxysporum TaxID=5507 RepID=A0A0J9VE52_FUSO4|nr:hypothetical protein FOXG_20169 [Fusarium oxysporum f. sp. lycopersici 4287]EWZ32588.1 hypothetical protein FOZG_14130 [Fusarium oxysporum Fo47]EXL45580.1 hypothetical protein FOCG_12958 [Fusarium oxysporum f. sp. radicis-lycopersici 26381]KNB09250.1 hypothetical protein FOXG_20169 [Fusarium oxysporum f. sp. lycopersici 4287]